MPSNTETLLDEILSDGGLKLSEVARRLRVSPPTVWRWIRHGVKVGGIRHRLEAGNIGRQFYTTENSLRRFLQQLASSRGEESPLPVETPAVRNVRQAVTAKKLDAAGL
ncbi:MAG: helix-turn-helix domain-containing protein [Gemmataceae bacterium]